VSAAAVAVLALGVGFGAAVWQWQRAENHRVRAVAMLVDSEAALDFMHAVLRDGVRSDETLTIDELLARSATIAEQSGRSDPRMRAVATDFVAGWYILYDQFERADQLLTRVIDSLPESLPSRSSLICNRAIARAQLGATDEAVAAIEREIARFSPDDPALSTCLQQRASLAIDLNAGTLGLTYALQALQHFDSSGLQSLRARSSLLEQVASAYSVKGMPDRAQEYYQQTFDLLDRLGRGDSLDASALLSNWGVTLFAAGNPLRARSAAAFDRHRSAAIVGWRACPIHQFEPGCGAAHFGTLCGSRCGL
ncbi:MAG: hypothetical protein ACREXP_30105, partial [Steroidobacteraceae bacterium]